MKKLLIVFALVFTLGAYTLVLQAGEVGKKERLKESIGPAGEGIVVTHGDASITIDSFGAAEQFQSGMDDHLYEALHFISVSNGRVERISNRNYTVITPVRVIEQSSGRTVARSVVQRNQGDLSVKIYNTIADTGEGGMDWYIEFYIENLTKEALGVCYYYYIDLDLFGDPDNNEATAGPHPDSGVLYFKLKYPPVPDSLFEVVPDLTAHNPKPTLRPDSFEMKPFPEIRDKLDIAQRCIELPNELSEITDDFTGALRYKATIADNDFVHVDLRVSRLQ